MKSEVRALEYAVSALVHKLDTLLMGDACISLGVGDGLHISTPDHLSTIEDAFVTVHPVGWPETSAIYARFLRMHGYWQLHEAGEICADHLFLSGRLRFIPTEYGMRVRLEPCGDAQGDLVAEGYARLIQSLEKDSFGK